MIGRVLGGIATSLLFSAFESWLVAEHNKVVAQIPLSTVIPNQLFVFPLKTATISYILDLFCFWFCLHLLPVVGI
jgi:hypothetical protein